MNTEFLIAGVDLLIISPFEAVPLTPEIALLRAELERPLSLSVTGAVSLGNYQGGYLYYLVAALRELRRLEKDTAGRLGVARVGEEVAPLTVATGASSGSINAFISAMAACRRNETRPRESAAAIAPRLAAFFGKPLSRTGT